jgi:hypothetical protein
MRRKRSPDPCGALLLRELLIRHTPVGAGDYPKSHAGQNAKSTGAYYTRKYQNLLLNYWAKCIANKSQNRQRFPATISW